MFGAVFIQLLPIGMVPALLNEMRVDLNASVWQLGWITGAYGLGRLVVDLPVGWLVTRLPPQNLLLISGITGTAGTLLAAFAPGPRVMILATTIFGVSSTISVILTYSLIGQNVREDASFAASMLEVCAIGSFTIAPVLAAASTYWLDWRWSFALAAAFIGTYFRWILGTKALHKQGSVIWESVGGSPTIVQKMTTATVQSRPQIATVAFVLIAAFALSFTWSGVRGFLLPLYAINELRLTTESLGGILSGAGLVSLPILIVVGWLAKLHGPRQVLVGGLCLIALSAISVLVTKNVPGFVMSFIGISVGFCVWGMPVGILSNLTDRATSPALFAMVKFVADSAYFLGTIVLTSLLTAFGFRTALLSASSLAVVAAALIGGDLLVSHRK